VTGSMTVAVVIRLQRPKLLTFTKATKTGVNQKVEEPTPVHG